MSNKLTKTTFLQPDGFTPEWVPGVPGSPAYCIDVTTSTTGQGGYYILIPPDPVTLRPEELFWVPTGFTTVTTTTEQCYPSTPGTPGYFVNTPNYQVDYNVGWTGSAVSVGTLAADGQYQFSVPTNVVGVVTGFNDLNGGSNYPEILFGLATRSERCRSTRSSRPTPATQARPWR